MNKNKNKNKIDVIIVLLLMLSVVCVFTGVSFSIFNYLGEGNTINVIQTGQIVFSYSDADGSNGGIELVDALPISDDVGKMLSGSKEYFDFTINATTLGTNLVYEITANKEDDSTLDSKYVKLYLTTFEGSNEVTAPLFNTSPIITYKDLENTTNSSLSGKTIYYGNVSAGNNNYVKKFRLRMWIADDGEVDFDDLNNKNFKVRVNVAATNSY